MKQQILTLVIALLIPLGTMASLNLDVYVSPNGNDTNSGTNPDCPFKTIGWALSQVYGTPENPVTIHLSPGLYSPSTNEEEFPLSLVSHVTIAGNTRNKTIIDAEYPGFLFLGAPVFHALDVTDVNITGLTIKRGSDSGVKIEGSDVEILDCILSYNSNGYSAAGGIQCRQNSHVSIIGCQIMHNNDRGIYNTNSIILMEHCEVINNVGYEGAGLFCDTGSISKASDCLFLSNSALHGGAIYTREADLELHTCVIKTNDAMFGGGMLLGFGSRCNISNCVISSNSATKVGGVYNKECDASFYNCLISDNFGGEVSAIFMNETNGEFINCTVVGNRTPDTKGVLCAIQSDCAIRNSIFWDNDHGLPYSSSCTVSYSNMHGGCTGEGNIDEDPLFCSGAMGHHYLSQTASGQPQNSPCLDTGNADATSVCWNVLGTQTCLNEYSTRTDHDPDLGIADMGFHYSDSYPMIPSTVLLSVDLKLKWPYIYPGRRFKLEAEITNFGPESYTDLPLVVMLEFHSNFFWYPTWDNAFNYLPVDLSIETKTIEILNFTWPDMPGKEEGVILWGALLNENFTAIMGQWDYETFAWGPNK